MRPVYMITGFLESGKSEFITYTLDQDYFQIRGTTLLILCEEGEVEYSQELLKKSKTVVEVIENEEDFNPDYLNQLDKKHKPERVVVEFNGMWNYRNVKLPWYWTIDQQITLIDGSTFPMYYTNMRSLLSEMLKKSELIIFNRCDGLGEELAKYRRNVKAVNQKAEIVFEDAKGEINQIFEEDLPYDIKQDTIPLDNYGYGIFYIDAFDNIDRYVGKNITFLAQVSRPEKLKKGYFVPGRMFMNCCAEDMTFCGFPCTYSHVDISAYNEKDWITITAKVNKEVWPEYDGQAIPVLDAVDIQPAKTPAPKEQIVSLV